MESQSTAARSNYEIPASSPPRPADAECAWALPAVLSVIAGSADVISFLGLGLFNAHVTGNLVILAGHIVARGVADLALVISVPIFVVALFLTKAAVARLERSGIKPLTPLLAAQFVLLAAFFVLCNSPAHTLDPNAGAVAVGSQLGVVALAVQNALVQLALKGTPSTAAMTANITRFTLDLGDAVLGRASGKGAEALRRAKQTFPEIAGFIVGAALGGVVYAATGLRSLALPAGLALVALGMGCLSKKR